MTGPAHTPGGCPDCGAPLARPGAPTDPVAACPSCALPLIGQLAAELGTLDRRLAALDTERAFLLERRRALLHELRGQRAAQRVSSPPAVQQVPAVSGAPAIPQFPAAPPVHPAAPTAGPRSAETPGRTVQNVLLALGGLLLAVAAVVFTVVAWGRFGIAGRAAILLALTAATLAVPRALVRRDLRATAETVAGLGLGLLLLDGYAAWHVGLTGGLAGSTYAGLVAALVAAAAAAYPGVVPVRIARPLAVVLAQPVPALLVAAADPRPTGWAAVAAVTVAADLALATRRPGRAETVLAVGGAASAWTLGTLAALTGLVADDGAGGAATAGLVLVVLGLLGVTAGALLVRAGRRSVLREVSGAWTVVATAMAAYVTASWVEGIPLAVVLAGTALVLAAGTAALPRPWRTGPAAGALTVTLVAGLVPAFWTAVAGVLPLSWVLDPWSGPAGSARDVLPAGLAWPGGTAPVVAAAGVAASAAVLTARWRGRGALRWVAVGAAVPVVLLGIFALDLPWALTLAVEGLAAFAGCATAVRRSGRLWTAWYAAGMLLGLHATLWATAGRVPTLVALALCTVAGAALAVIGRRDPVAAPAVVLGLLALTAELGAAGAAAGFQGRTVAALTGLGAVPALAVTAALRRRWPVSATAAAWTVPVTVAGAAAVAVGHGTDPGVAAALGAVAVAAAAVLAPEPPSRQIPYRLGLAVLAALGALVAVVASLPAVATALAGTGTVARSAPVTLALTALAAALLGVVIGAPRRALPAALPLAAAAVVTVPAALGWGWAASLTVTTIVAVAAAFVAGLLPVRTAAARATVAAATAVAAVVGGAALLRSLDRAPAALAVCAAGLLTGCVLAAMARTAVARRVATVLAVAAGHGVAAAAGTAAGLPVHTTALLVLAAAALTTGAATLLRDVWPVRSRLAEAGAALGALVAVALTAGHLWHTGLVLVLTGAVLSMVALRRDRRPAGIAAVVAKLAASWAWLAAAEVHTAEAYTLPAALVTLAAGALYLRRHPRTSSWPTLAPGLVAAFLPSLLVSLTGPDEPLRRLLLGVAALGVTLAGGARRRQAPFALGAAVLAVVAVRELGPVFADVLAAVPSWVPLSLGGILLVTVGATYEQRRRDLSRVRAAVLRMN